MVMNNCELSSATRP